MPVQNIKNNNTQILKYTERETRTMSLQVKQSIARLKLVWDERMKMKNAIRAEEKAIEDKARAEENKIRRNKRKEEKYIQKKMAQFANATPEQS